MININVFRGKEEDFYARHPTLTKSRFSRFRDRNFKRGINKIHIKLERPHKMGHTSFELDIIKFSVNRSFDDKFRMHYYNSTRLNITFKAYYSY